MEKPSDYEDALHTYANIPGMPDYSDVSEYDEVSNGNSGNSPNDEDIFVDPGHNAVDMCTCFEKKMCCLIKNSDIR